MIGPGGQIIEVQGDVVERYMKRHHERTQQQYYLEAAIVVIRATHQAAVRVGDNRVVVNEGGVQIHATRINLNCKDTPAAPIYPVAPVEDQTLVAGPIEDLLANRTGETAGETARKTAGETAGETARETARDLASNRIRKGVPAPASRNGKIDRRPSAEEATTETTDHME